MGDKEFYDRGDDYKNMAVASITFIKDNNKIVHTRRVFTYMDWLGMMGGLWKVLSGIFIRFLFKGFSVFNSRIETLKSTHLFCDTHNH